MKIDFIGNSKKFFAISLLLIVAIIICNIVMGAELDIQFKGGALLTYSYNDEIGDDEATDIVRSVIDDNVSVQFGDDLATGETTMTVSVPGNVDNDTITALNGALTAAFPESKLSLEQSSNVDPTIGREFLGKCAVAIGLASVLMVVYIAIRFRKIGGWSAGVMSLVALFHDVFIAYGIFIIFRIPINDNFIAVVLTILGFSLNDTIVIYDRIRENKTLMGAKTPLAELVNTSINQSFSRSVVTSVCAVVAMLVVTIVAAIYGVESILTFSLPMVMGLICGSYSSICIAGPLWVRWREFWDGREKEKKSK